MTQARIAELVPDSRLPAAVFWKRAGTYDEGMLPGPADLHAHSRVSDGTDSPAGLIAAAAAAGVATVALTDHDTTSGWAEASAAVPGSGVTLLPGMELSTRHGWASVHVLGYLVDPTSADLVAETERIRGERLLRAQTMVHRIAVDYSLDWADVEAQTAPGSTIGRPHIADALVARGHAANRSAAFAGILHWRAGYYTPHYAPEPLVGVRLIRAAGGVPVLAHPATGGRERAPAEDYLKRLVDAGLFGMEIDHRENTPDGKLRLHELARQFGLAVTGSSDYHGSGKPNRLGENTTEAAVVERIVAEATGFSPVTP